MSGPDPGAYGATSGPRDGEPQGYQPIPTPAAPASAQPTAGSQASSVPEQGWHPGRGAGNFDRMSGLMAISVPLATLAFFILGFTTGGWGWAWIVFLIPPILRAYERGGRRNA